MTSYMTLACQLARAMQLEQPYSPDEMAGMLMIRGLAYSECDEVLANLVASDLFYVQGGNFYLGKQEIA